jgi:hypothetical protein
LFCVYVVRDHDVRPSRAATLSASDIALCHIRGNEEEREDGCGIVRPFGVVCDAIRWYLHGRTSWYTLCTAMLGTGETRTDFHSRHRLTARGDRVLQVSHM